MSSKKTTATDPGATTVDVATLVSELHAPFEAADAERAASLASLADARTARGYMLQRKRDALAARAGADAPEVAALDAEIATNAAFATSVATQSSLAAHPPPAPAADETVVHGFVRDAASKPISGVKVTLAQPNGNPLVSTASAKDGHFVLRFKAAAKAEVPDKLEVRVHDKRHPTPIELERGNGLAFIAVNLED